MLRDELTATIQSRNWGTSLFGLLSSNEDSILSMRSYIRKHKTNTYNAIVGFFEDTYIITLWILKNLDKLFMIPPQVTSSIKSLNSKLPSE